MNKTYAVIFNTFVENIIQSDLPISDILVDPNRNLVEILDNHQIGAGYRYDGEKFLEPIMFNTYSQDPIELLKTVVELITEDQRNSLLQILSGQVVPKT